MAASPPAEVGGSSPPALPDPPIYAMEQVKGMRGSVGTTISRPIPKGFNGICTLRVAELRASS